jgi:hypothetical protein
VGDLPPTRAVLARVAPDSLVPVGDAAATGKVLRGALELPTEARAEVASVLRDWAVREADHDANMRRMEELYRKLLDR